MDECVCVPNGSLEIKGILPKNSENISGVVASDIRSLGEAMKNGKDHLIKKSIEKEIKWNVYFRDSKNFEGLQHVMKNVLLIMLPC